MPQQKITKLNILNEKKITDHTNRFQHQIETHSLICFFSILNSFPTKEKKRQHFNCADFTANDLSFFKVIFKISS